MAHTERSNTAVFMGVAFAEKIAKVTDGLAADGASVVGAEGAGRTVLVGVAFGLPVVFKVTADRALILDAEGPHDAVLVLGTLEIATNGALPVHAERADATVTVSDAVLCSMFEVTAHGTLVVDAERAHDAIGVLSALEIASDAASVAHAERADGTVLVSGALLSLIR